jgi:hypothetical protein
VLTSIAPSLATELDRMPAPRIFISRWSQKKAEITRLAVNLPRGHVNCKVGSSNRSGTSMISFVKGETEVPLKLVCWRIVRHRVPAGAARRVIG